MRLLCTLAGCAALLAAEALARSKGSDALRLPMEELRARVKSICLFATGTQTEPEKWEEKRAWLEKLLARKLAQGGFRVVMPESVEALAKLVAKELGGSYDPHTGEPDPAKAGKIEQQLAARLRSQFECDALLRAQVEEVIASWSAGVASWDHVKHRMGPPVEAIGTVGALSLFVELRAIDGRILFERAAGVQTLATLVGTRFRLVAPEEVLSAQWSTRAVIVALDELAPVTREVAACLTAAYRKRTRTGQGSVGRPSPREIGQVARWSRAERRGMEARARCEMDALLKQTGD